MKVRVGVLGLISALCAMNVHAEMKILDDQDLREALGQSGLMMEVNIGSPLDKSDITNINWSNAGIVIDAFKWEVDMENYSSTTNEHSTSSSGTVGGLIARDIRVVGALDVAIDVSRDGGAGRNAVSFDFSSSNIDIRVGSMAAYSSATGVGPSMGAIEILSMNIDNVDMFIGGR